MLHSPKPFPDKQAFATWLEIETGLTRGSSKDVRKSFLTIHTWNSDDIIDHITANWEKLPEEIRSTLRLKQIWTTLPS